MLAILGGLHRESNNRSLLHLAVRKLEQHGVKVEHFELAPLPIFNEDVEAHGFPPAVVALRHAIGRADAMVIASPEYNSSIPGVLKNAIDWASRPPNPFEGKVAFIMAATKGRSGAFRMHMHLSYILASLGVWVVPQPQVLLTQADGLFTMDGELIDASVRDLLDQAMTKLLDAARKLGKKS